MINRFTNTPLPLAAYSAASGTFPSAFAEGTKKKADPSRPAYGRGTKGSILSNVYRSWVSFAEYHQYDALGLAALIRNGETSASEVLGAAIDTIERHNPVINAVVYKLYERAQVRVNRGLPEGPFTGVPFLLKDLALAYRAVPLTNGSRSMANFVPNYNGTLADRFEAAGLVIMGKTNTSEFGMAPVCEPELHGTTSNPWNPARTSEQSFRCLSWPAVP